MSTSCELRPEHHAVMFGLLARDTLRVFGMTHGDRLLYDMVRTYAMERGHRMRMRVDANGDTPDPANYMAYGEWRGGEGFSKELIHLEPFYAYRVLACPWCAAWKAHGMEEYGPYYCRCADVALVEGFNSALILEMPTWLSGGEFCEFRWPGFAMDKATQERIAAKRDALGVSGIKGWDYHTAHMCASMGKTLKAEDPILGAAVLSRVREDFTREMGKEAMAAIDAQAGQDFSKPAEWRDGGAYGSS